MTSTEDTSAYMTRGAFESDRQAHWAKDRSALPSGLLGRVVVERGAR